MRSIAIACVALALAGCSVQEVDHAAFDRILAATVRGDRIDYLVLRRDHRAELERYLDRMARVDAERLPREEQIAYYANLYNATMIAAVIGRLRADWTPAEDSFAIFKEPLVRLRGRTISLDQLEKEVLPAVFDDPRLHAALVCGARSCPPLPGKAFGGDDVEQVLDARMQQFLRDARRNHVDAEGRKVELSQIFEWNAKDFGGEGEVAGYAGRELGVDLTGFDVTFRQYDWKLNLAPPADGSWLEIAAPRAQLLDETGRPVGASLGRGEIVEQLGQKGDLVRARTGDGAEVWLRTDETRPFVVPE